MTFRDLEYFVAVVDLGHFGRAAAHCHASQSALSLQLKKLETELGVQLIERTNRRVVVSPSGLALAERARELLHSRQEFLDEAALEIGQMPGTITLGMIPTIAPYQIGPVFKAMKQMYPGTTLRIVEDFFDDWPGALVVVSHDRTFLDRSVDRLLVVEEDGHVRPVVGGVAAFVEHLTGARATSLSAPARRMPTRTAPPTPSVAKRRSMSTLSRLMHEADKSITRLVKERNRITEELAATPDYVQLAALGVELTAIEERLTAAENGWLALAEEAEHEN